MGFVYRVVWVLKGLWIVLSETINIFRNLHKTNILGCPWKFYHRVVYIAPSSGHELLKFNLPFKLILRRFEVVFWCLEWECCPFQKIDEIQSKFTNTTIMALKQFYIFALSFLNCASISICIYFHFKSYIMWFISSQNIWYPFFPSEYILAKLVVANIQLQLLNFP